MFWVASTTEGGLAGATGAFFAFWGGFRRRRKPGESGWGRAGSHCFLHARWRSGGGPIGKGTLRRVEAGRGGRPKGRKGVKGRQWAGRSGTEPEFGSSGTKGGPGPKSLSRKWSVSGRAEQGDFKKSVPGRKQT